MAVPAKELAKLLARYGRNGDTELVHMNRHEVHALRMLSGLASEGMTINPDTGLPEAFNLSWLIPIAAIAAIALTGGAAAAPLAETAAGTGAAVGTAAGTTAAADAAAVAATDAAAGLGGSAGYAATLGNIANAGQTALATNAGLSTLPAAGQSIAQAAQMAQNTNAVAPYLANTNAMPAAQTPSLLSKVGTFAENNPLMTLGAVNMLGNMMTPKPKTPEEDKDFGPKNEFRPGEGNVPFQQKGVRYGINAPISADGTEAMRIGYGPSIGSQTLQDQIDALKNPIGPGFKSGPMDDLRLRRRFAEGGLATHYSDGRPIPGWESNEVRKREYEAQKMLKERDRRIEQGAKDFAERDAANRKQAAYPKQKHPTRGPIPDSGWRYEDGSRAPSMDEREFYSKYGVDPRGDYYDYDKAHAAELGLGDFNIGGNDKYRELERYRALTAQRSRQAQLDYNGFPISDAPYLPKEPPEKQDSFYPGYAAGGIAQGAGPSPIPMPPIANPAPLGVPRSAPMPTGGLGNSMIPQPPAGMPAPQGGPQGQDLSPQDQQLVMAAAAALAGKLPNPAPVIKAFVAKFGPEALAELVSAVKGAAKQAPVVPPNMGRLLSGPGGGTEDKIPAQIDGQQPAALSSGEFVVPAHAVAGLGDGSTEHGARKLQKMVNKVNKAKYGRTTNPEPIDDTEVMPI